LECDNQRTHNWRFSSGGNERNHTVFVVSKTFDRCILFNLLLFSAFVPIADYILRPYKLCAYRSQGSVASARRALADKNATGLETLIPNWEKTVSCGMYRTRRKYLASVTIFCGDIRCEHKTLGPSRNAELQDCRSCRALPYGRARMQKHGYSSCRIVARRFARALLDGSLRSPFEGIPCSAGGSARYAPRQLG